MLSAFHVQIKPRGSSVDQNSGPTDKTEKTTGCLGLSEVADHHPCTSMQQMRFSLGQCIKYAYQSKWKKINLKTQIGHIYMLKMSHSYHFSGGGSVVSSHFSSWGVEGRKVGGNHEGSKEDALCKVGGGGLEMNAVDTPAVPTQRWGHSKVFSLILHRTQACGRPLHFPLSVLVEQIIASFQNK